MHQVATALLTERPKGLDTSKRFVLVWIVRPQRSSVAAQWEELEQDVQQTFRNAFDRALRRIGQQARPQLAAAQPTDGTIPH
jgi:hypothetical protein